MPTALGRYSRVDGRKSSSSSPSSSSGGYCSTVTLVVFVGLCLVGVWMMTSSSSIVPVVVQTSQLEDAKSEVRTQVVNESINETSSATDRSDNNDQNNNNDEGGNTRNSKNQSSTKQFEDNPGDLPEDATKGDAAAGNVIRSSSTVADQEENINKSSTSHQDKTTNIIAPEKTTTENSAEGGVHEEEKPAGKQQPTSSSHEEEETKAEDASRAAADDTINIQGKKEEGESNKTVVVRDTDSSESRDQSKSADGDENRIRNSDRQGNSSKDHEDLGGGKNKSDGGSNIDDDAIMRKPEDVVDETKDGRDRTKEEETSQVQEEDKVDQKKEKVVVEPKQQLVKEELDKSSSRPGGGGEKNEEDGNEKTTKLDSDHHSSSNEELFPSGAAELLNETSTPNGSSFSTQAAQSKNAKAVHKSSEHERGGGYYKWKLCNVTAGSDYIPCLDNLLAIKSLKTTKHYEHRERHCPEDPPTCLVPLPKGYQRSIEWPKSREKIWYHNVPHTKLAEVKGHQNWVKVSGEYLTFPGGGTQFKHGALHYIDFIQQLVPGIDWGNRSRVVLDVGCGVASFGGFLFDRDVLTMSFAPKDEHEAQVQFALERGIPAISSVMGTLRLPYPGRVFDVVHCARCRVPWHIEGGKLLLELNRLLRPGGYFVWSATPIYQKLPEDVEIWDAMKKLTRSMCWEVVSIGKDRVNGVGVAIYRKPSNNECYEKRSENDSPLCKESDDPNAAWGVPLQSCMHKVPVSEAERGSQWPLQWPARLEKPPYWLLSTQVGVYGKPAPEDFTADYQHWKRVVSKSYINGLGINWSTVRNAMDMRSVYGGFAAALRDMNVWVMNVVSIDAPDTLPIIYERGLFGIYHNWCESFNTYPRSYDLLHADHIFSKIKTKCNFEALVAEVDRILRPGGKLIVRDKVEIINELQTMLKSMRWEVRLTYSKDKEGLLYIHKSMWRPQEFETMSYAIIA